ncbi:MAG TPA: hypothetical protein VE153_38515 [Myxococcus sp.]|nr:hypothetical protein [Myxococcus sp.]
MKLTVEELIARASHYWPADFEWHARGERPPEIDRLFGLYKQEWPRRGTQWLALVEALRQQLPGYSIYNSTVPSDPSFRFTLRPPKEQLKPRLEQMVVGCMSLIAPVYSVYGLQYEYKRGKRSQHSNARLFLGELPPELKEPAEVAARQIEAHFGVERLTPDVAETPVPLYVDLKFPPHATLFHALISDQADSVY